MTNQQPSSIYSNLTNMMHLHRDSILVVEDSGEVLFANLAASRLLCRLPANAGRIPNELRHADDEPVRVNIKDITGQELILSLHSQIIDWQGKPAFFLHIQDITAQAKQTRLLEQLVYRDELTGLYNRRGLEHAMSILSSLPATASTQPMSVLYIDINGLKKINDTLGHPQGDAVIHETAQVLSQIFYLTDIKARIGGDEFVVLHKHQPNRSLQPLITDLHTEIRRRNDLPGRPYQLSLSIGSINQAASQTLALADILAQADQCMYQAKQRQPHSCLRHFNSTAIETPRPAPHLFAGTPPPFSDLLRA